MKIVKLIFIGNGNKKSNLRESFKQQMESTTIKSYGSPSSHPKEPLSSPGILYGDDVQLLFKQG